MNETKKQKLLEALERAGLTKDGLVTEKGAELMEKLDKMPDVYQKHHYKEWSTDTSQLGGLMRTSLGPREAHSKCSRCGVIVKTGATTKFWVNGKWTRKRPPCQVPV